MLIAIISISLLNFLCLVLLIIWSFKGGGSNTRDTFERLVELRNQVERVPELIEMRVEKQNSKVFSQLKDDFSTLRETMTDKLVSFQTELSKVQVNEFEKLRGLIEKNLDKISMKVRENLDEGFKKTNETFQNVIERLAKIDEAQKNIDSLSKNVTSLQDVLTDKKSRGVYGEVHLKQILTSVFGENNEKIYKIQYQLDNQKIVDAAIFLPEPIGVLCVDSKFPLENYKRMIDRDTSEEKREASRKDFVRNLKKHIDDIASKYIVPGKTADQAILFLPAEAIFSEIHAYHHEIVDYANSRKVWLTSPTTFLATLTTVQVILINLERNKYMSVIHEELNKLGEEFGRYQSRWDDLARHIDTVGKDVKLIHTTSQKISGRFEKIKHAEIEDIAFIEESLKNS